MSYLVIINPISGDIDKSSFKKNLKKLFEDRDIFYEIYETRQNNDDQFLISKIEQLGINKILICGGDGTFNMFADVLQITQIPVGFVPMGSANGLAADMGIEGTPLQVVRKYLSTKEVGKMDCLMINKEYPVLHLADIGLNANMIKDYEKDTNRGWFTYAKHALSHLQNVANFRVNVHHGEDRVFSQGVMVAVCNGKTFGTTGVRLNRISDIADGKFEIVIIKALKFENLIRATLSRFDEDWFETGNYEVLQTEQAEIQLEKPMQLQIDGEIIDEFDNITIQIRPDAVHYLKI